MAYACQICGKTNAYGRSQRHKRGVAGKRWKFRAQETKRLFKVNLQKVALKVNDKKRQMRICTNCLKRIKKYKAVRQYKNIAVV